MADNEDANKPEDAQEATGQEPGSSEAEAPESAAPEQPDPLARAEALAQEYKDQLLRTRAEAENQRKRMERENANAVKYAAEKVFRDLLAVADSLDLGLKAAHEAEAGASVVEGLELTRKQLADTLSRHGVQELDPAGAPFDPEVHEAVSMFPSSEVAPNHVLEVVQKGYQLHERVLRPARVVVAAAQQGEGDDAQ